MARRKRIKNLYCKLCGVPILRVKTVDGSWINLDVDPVLVMKHGFKDTFITREGGYIFGMQAGDACEELNLAEAYVPHWIVCSAGGARRKHL